MSTTPDITTGAISNATVSLQPGESAVGGISLKQKCEKVTPERALAVEARFVRKPGQSDVDPKTGDYTSGQFESWTRFDLLDPNLNSYY